MVVTFSQLFNFPLPFYLMGKNFIIVVKCQNFRTWINLKCCITVTYVCLLFAASRMVLGSKALFLGLKEGSQLYYTCVLVRVTSVIVRVLLL